PRVELGGRLVGVPRMDRAGSRRNSRYTVWHQTVHEVEIMDHEVEDHAHVGASSGPGSETPAGNLLRHFGEIEQAGLREYETLLMANRQHLASAFGERNQLVGFIEIGCNRLLDQD